MRESPVLTILTTVFIIEEKTWEEMRRTWVAISITRTKSSKTYIAKLISRMNMREVRTKRRLRGNWMKMKKHLEFTRTFLLLFISSLLLLLFILSSLPIFSISLCAILNAGIFTSVIPFLLLPSLSSWSHECSSWFSHRFFSLGVLSLLYFQYHLSHSSFSQLIPHSVFSISSFPTPHQG